MKYLSQIRESLPLNVMYNKVRVGCGGTTLALTSNQPYVICVPYVSLVDNKVAQTPVGQSWLAVKGGVTKDVIKAYLDDCDTNNLTPKIIVTYDGLPKVTAMLNPQDFYLLIDEYHILFQQYAFRYNAIQGVLTNFRKYKAFTFMTATPIDIDLFKQFTLKELRDIPVEMQVWDDKNEIDVKVEACKCTSVTAKVVDLVQKHLNGTINGNAYFFCNSTKFIDNVFETIRELNNENTRVIYSKNNNAEYSFERGFVEQEPKRINFITSTAFEGCDIYDENGVTYIVSDAYKKHTLLDISSSVQQIIGRIRNSRYKGMVVHIYSVDRYADISPYEFDEQQERQRKACIEFAERVNSSLNTEDIEKIKGFTDEIPYSVVRFGEVIYDDNLALLDAYQYRIRNQYSCKASVETAYKNIYADVFTNQWKKSLHDIGIFETNTNMTFRQAVNACRDASTESKFVENNLIARYEGKFPVLRPAIRRLGYSRIITLNYSQKAIKDALIKENDKGTTAMKVIAKLNIPNGAWVSCKELKAKLEKAYKVLGITQAVKATDIENYYSCEKRNKRVKDTLTRGYVIFLPKYKEMK